ncbi:MAG: SDR family NAD(P)-dependent oxidoreductase [Bacteroidota bacterium]
MQLSKGEQARLKAYGKWALITGASSGIGAELARQLASSRLDLILVSRGASELEALATELKMKYDTQCRILSLDLSKTESTVQLLAAVSGLDIGLVALAAGYGTSGHFLQADLDQELNMLDLNCRAILSQTHHFAQRFAERGKGGIILFGSLVGFQGTPYAAHYAATKAYVQTLAEALHVELKDSGVDVLSAAPGPVNTSFAERANMQMGAALRPEDVGVPILRALGKRQTVLPGFLTKFLVGSLRTLPRWGKVRVMKLVMGGMTEHQREVS